MKSIKRNAKRVAAATVASGLLAAGAVALAGSASASTLQARGSSATVYRFQILDNANDQTFNQLLGINDEGLIAGYFGSGAAGHPNKGYLLEPNHAQYINEYFPGSVQTQVTGLNNRGVTVGFWSPTNMGVGMDANSGFVDVGGQFRNANYPTGNPASPPVDQLLGVNDKNIAVGFYTDGNGINHGYEYNVNTTQLTRVLDPNAPTASLTAAAINNRGDVAGVYTNPATGKTDGFLLRHGKLTDLVAPGASSTMALGVNNLDEVVGVYVPSGNSNALDGFTWTPQHGFRSLDDPQGQGTTTINGVNDSGQVVGFFVNAVGNTDGFLATPRR